MSSASAALPSAPSRVVAALAYSGWWVTGLLLWLVERRDPFVRFHASQACVLFGPVALVVGLLAALATAALFLMPSAFPVVAWTAGIAWGAGLVLWGTAMWQAAHGRLWRAPGVAPLADRLSRW